MPGIRLLTGKDFMRRFVLGIVLFAGIAAFAQSQAAIIGFVGTPTGSCASGQMAANAATGDLYWCNSTAWTRYVPAGIISMQISGSCQAGWTQVMALNGQFLQGTLAANGDVGTTGGNATITPAGTNSTAAFTPAGTNSTAAFTPAGTVAAPTFSGTQGTTSATSAGTPAGTVAAIAATSTTAVVVTTGSGNNVAAQTHTHAAPAFTGSALATHTHTLTPAGTNSAPGFTGTAGTVPAETFTGTAVDPRPQFTKVIFCSKN